MGNHEVGRSMSNAAKMFWMVADSLKMNPTKEQALLALDLIAEDYRGADAEFDDDMHTWTPLSRLVSLAFDASPDNIRYLKEDIRDDEDSEQFYESWYENVYKKFSERYDFC